MYIIFFELCFLIVLILIFVCFSFSLLSVWVSIISLKILFDGLMINLRGDIIFFFNS